MRPFLTTAFVMVATLGLAGCYDSAVPIDSVPALDLDPAVIGVWRCLPLGGKVTDNVATMVVAQLRPRVYAITFDDEEYEAYLSAVQGKSIVNVKSLSAPKSKEWSFIRYTFLRPGVLQLVTPGDKAINDEPPPTSLRHVFEMLPDSAYEDFAICVRAAEK